MIPRQPPGESLDGANSGRAVFLEDERRASITNAPLSARGLFLKKLEVSYYDDDFYEVTQISVHL